MKIFTNLHHLENINFAVAKIFSNLVATKTIFVPQIQHEVADHPN